MKPRRSVFWQWIVTCWRLANQERDKRIAESAARRERAKMQKEMQEQLRPVFAEKPVYIPVASVRFLDKPPTLASYEPPHKETGPTRPVNPDALKRLIGTTTLPAIPGEMVRKYKEQQRRAGR